MQHDTMTNTAVGSSSDLCYRVGITTISSGKFSLPVLTRYSNGSLQQRHPSDLLVVQEMKYCGAVCAYRQISPFITEDNTYMVCVGDRHHLGFSLNLTLFAARRITCGDPRPDTLRWC